MKKIWKTLTDSWWGNILLGFVAAVIFYYVILSNLLGNNTPVVAVVSSSMYHGPSDKFNTLCNTPVSEFKKFDDYWEICDETYEGFRITKETFSAFPFRNGFAVGDMPIVRGSKDYNVGDIIVYSVEGINAPIIHRIVAVTDDGIYQTKGDNNSGQLDYEFSVLEEQIKGKVIFIIPKIGYFKVVINRLFGV